MIDPNDLRDDVTGLVQDDVVADADVLAAHLVEVVQRGPRDRRARDLDRPACGRPASGFRCGRHTGTMSSTTVSTCSGGNLKAIAQRGRATTMPSRRCEVEAVDLDDDAVGLVGQRRGAAPASAR